MKEIFKKNIDALVNKYPQIYNRIKAIEERRIDIEVLPSKDNNRYMNIALDGKKINLNSKYRPLEEASRWVNSIDLEDNSKIILFGIGLGYRVKKIIEKMSKDNIIIVIEPSAEIFLASIKNVDITDVILNNKVFLLVEEDEFNVKKTLDQYITLEHIDQLCYEYIPNYNLVFDKSFKKYEKVLSEVIRDLSIAQNTKERFAKIWLNNYVQNLKHVFGSVDVGKFANKFRNMPAVIVSAGPSLNINVKLLKKVKGKAVIICVGTAVKVLLKEGIVPDIIATIDGDKKNYFHFKDVDYSSIPILYNPVVYPEILNKHNAVKIVTGGLCPYLGEYLFTRLKSIEVLEVGGSVAHLAFSFARKIGANPIVLVGQDLSYGNNNQSHAIGSSYSDGILDMNEPDEKKKLKIKGINGDEVTTDIVFYKFLRWFEKEINNDESNRIYINATEGGAYIKGTITMTLEEVLDKYLKHRIDADYIIQEIYKDRNAISKQGFSLVLEDLKVIINKLRDVSYSFEKGIEKLKQLKTLITNEVCSSEIEKLTKDVNEIKNSFTNNKEIYKVLQNMLSHDCFKQNIIYPNSTKQGYEIYINNELNYYENIRNSANYVENLVFECVENSSKAILHF